MCSGFQPFLMHSYLARLLQGITFGENLLQRNWTLSDIYSNRQFSPSGETNFGCIKNRNLLNDRFLLNTNFLKALIFLSLARYKGEILLF